MKKNFIIIGILAIILSSCRERPSVVDAPCSNIETIISAWNESSEMKVEFTKIKNDTLYVNIPDASHMTQRMGSTGAMQILASLVYALTENHTFVYIDFEEGDHASPGKYTRENFQFVVCYSEIIYEKNQKRMNIGLLILLVLVIIIAIPFIVAIFLKKDYLIEREIIINRPKQEVFDYIKHLKNQNEWSKWATTDPSMKATYSGTDGMVGFTYTWDSDNKTVGKGMQEITKITDGEYVGYIEWDFRFVGKPHTQCYWITENVSENATRMTWGFTGRVSYPMNFMILFFEKLIGDGTLSPELANLKTKLENQ